MAAAAVDPDRWSADDLRRILDADNARRGWSWPSTATNPAGLLLRRLRALREQLRGPSPTEQAWARKHANDSRRAAAASSARPAPASAEHRARVIAEFQARQRADAARRTAESELASAAVDLSDHVAIIGGKGRSAAQARSGRATQQTDAGENP